MLKSKRKLIELENRIILLERALLSKESSKTADPVDEMSYKEILDEWLNGKKNYQ